MPSSDGVQQRTTEHKQREQDGIVAAFERGEMRGVMAPAKRISTHLSHVLLSDSRAFKLKRAVCHSLVDFSRVEQRRAACEAEFVHNSHMSGALYEAVLPVTQGRDRRYAIDGVGEIVDWIVLMRRFDGSQRFDCLAKRGALNASLVERLVERIAAFHATTPVAVSAGYVAEYRNLLNNLLRAESVLDASTGGPPNASLVQSLHGKLSRISSMIERRRMQGYVRRGHGNMHLRNVCLFDGAPMPFNALEFNEGLSTTDVLYDLASLLMDLRRVGLPACADAAARRYWTVAGKAEDAAQLLPFFMATRAAVHMAIAAETGDFVGAAAYRRFAARLLVPSVEEVLGRGVRAFA